MSFLFSDVPAKLCIAKDLIEADGKSRKRRQ